MEALVDPMFTGPERNPPPAAHCVKSSVETYPISLSGEFNHWRVYGIFLPAVLYVYPPVKGDDPEVLNIQLAPVLSAAQNSTPSIGSVRVFDAPVPVQLNSQ
jgi:hypothetical protein